MIPPVVDGQCIGTSYEFSCPNTLSTNKMRCPTLVSHVAVPKVLHIPSWVHGVH